MDSLFGGKDSADGRSVYLSRGWREAERGSAERIGEALQAHGLRLVCDWTDQPHYDENRVREIMEGTGGFAAIRAQSSSDAIVDIWWDYGHWAKYFTGRPVALDGASLQNQSVHWMARALAATNDAEAIGLLRMMNCGNVTDPDGGSPARPYDMLVRWSADPGLHSQRGVCLVPRSV